MVLLTPIALLFSSTAAFFFAFQTFLTNKVVTCPAGFQPFFSVQSAFVPRVGVEEVWKYIGNFSDTTWQNGTLTGTTGSGNSQPGDTRVKNALGASVTETLILNAYGAQYLSGHLQAYTTVGTLAPTAPLAAGGVKIIEVINVLGAANITVPTSVGGFAGTVLGFVTTACTNDTVRATTIFDGQKGGYLRGVINFYGGR